MHITLYFQAELQQQQQHGFRGGHSTTTALCTASHTKLLQDIYDSSLPNVYKRWMANYMAGRQSFVEFRGSRSGFRKNRQGILQGGALSPLLVNTYISKITTPPPELKLIWYADDCTVITSDSDIEVLEVVI